jgi:hypothetical protein
MRIKHLGVIISRLNTFLRYVASVFDVYATKHAYNSINDKRLHEDQRFQAAGHGFEPQQDTRFPGYPKSKSFSH